MGGNPEIGSIRVKKVNSNAKLPSKAHDTDAGFDLYAEKYSSIPVGETRLIGTGIAMAIPRGYAGLIWDRSSMGVKGLHSFGGVGEGAPHDRDACAIIALAVKRQSSAILFRKRLQRGL